MKTGRRILVLYAGGTIGMVRENGTYKPGEALPDYLAQLAGTHPELREHDWQVQSLSPLLDSANAGPADWHGMAVRLWQAGSEADAAVVLHGTDTMDYACAFLSFFMHGWGRPVVFTGSQLPLGAAGSDAEANLLQALRCALQAPGLAMLCMGGRVLSASRIYKLGVDPVQGFQSPHWPDLARARGHGIEWQDADRTDVGGQSGTVPAGLELLAAWSRPAAPSVGVLRLYPGMPAELLAWMGERHPQGLVLQAYGSGTGPTASKAFCQALARLHEQGVPMVAVSQCPWAQADLATYEAGRLLMEAGVLPGQDMSTAAAYAKLHYLAALRRADAGWKARGYEALQAWMSRPVAGEIGKP